MPMSFSLSVPWAHSIRHNFARQSPPSPPPSLHAHQTMTTRSFVRIKCRRLRHKCLSSSSVALMVLTAIMALLLFLSSHRPTEQDAAYPLSAAVTVDENDEYEVTDGETEATLPPLPPTEPAPPGFTGAMLYVVTESYSESTASTSDDADADADAVAYDDYEDDAAEQAYEYNDDEEITGAAAVAANSDDTEKQTERNEEQREAMVENEQTDATTATMMTTTTTTTTMTMTTTRAGTTTRHSGVRNNNNSGDKADQAEEIGAPLAVPREKQISFEAASAESARALIQKIAANVFSVYRRRATAATTRMSNSRVGLDLIDGMDTLHLLGMRSELAWAQQWTRVRLEDIMQHSSAHMRESEISMRIVGGLLSMHALSGDQYFLSAAKSIAVRLLPAFNTRTGLPSVNKSSRCAQMSEVSAYALEFTHLSRLTGDTTFVDRVNKAEAFVRSLLRRSSVSAALPFQSINTATGKWCSDIVSVSAQTAVFYETQLKQWLYANTNTTTTTGGEPQRRTRVHMPHATLDAVVRTLISEAPVGAMRLTYVGAYNASTRSLSLTMTHAACIASSLFALSAADTQSDTDNDNGSDDTGRRPRRRQEHYERLAAEIARTCRQFYVQSEQRLGARQFAFADSKLTAENVSGGGGGGTDRNALFVSSEAAEAYFYLWRTTRQRKYRDWAWALVAALDDELCGTANDAAARQCELAIDANDASDAADNGASWESSLLGETLKYLYLVFCDDHMLPLDKYVLNARGHPLAISLATAHDQTATAAATVTATATSPATMTKTSTTPTAAMATKHIYYKKKKPSNEKSAAPLKQQRPRDTLIKTERIRITPVIDLS